MPVSIRLGKSAATAASILLAYLFLLAAGRILGSEDYGSLAALLGFLLVVYAGAVAMLVGAEIVADCDARAG